MIRRGVLDGTPKDPIRKIGAKVKETKVGTMVVITARVIMYDMGLTTATTTSTGVTMVTEMIGVGHMFNLKITKLILGMVKVVWHELKICCRK